MERQVGIRDIFPVEFKGVAPVLGFLHADKQQLPPGIQVVLTDFPIDMLGFNSECFGIPGDGAFSARVGAETSVLGRPI